MRILAVIPARAGSKGIPNKNIRLLSGKPLIYYSIKNALESKYITDVIVSTDSKTVETICSQMNVNVKRRKNELCGDEVTLDSVVFDACKDFDIDYVVTMQPTSPTLKVSTLDEAILYAVENNLDTLISVINKPHLSWREIDGKKLPNYKERLNRQFLPANYVETGAFVISRKEVVTVNTRIGDNMDVFEISEDEAIDIDSFYDLIVAEHYLNKKNIAFIVNGNNQIGMGHISRVLELADEFYVKPDIFFDKNQTEYSMFGNTTHTLIGVNGMTEIIQEISRKPYDLIINDILDTSIEYMRKLKEISSAKIVNFEDCGDGCRYADLVINALYDESNMSNVKCGQDYYVIPKAFLLYKPIEIKEQVTKIFISFGGADPQNYTDRILKIISKEKYSAYEFIVVLGKAKDNISELMKYNLKSNIKVFFDVENMAQLMSECDAAVTSRGRTGYELGTLGIPTIAMAQNNREACHRFISEENGYIYLGLNPNDYVIEANIDILINMDINMRSELQSRLLRYDYRQGRKRVVNIINSI